MQLQVEYSALQIFRNELIKPDKPFASSHPFESNLL